MSIRNELLEDILVATSGGGGTLPQGGPFVVQDGGYVPDSSSGITINNFLSVNYGIFPFETSNNFYVNPVTGLSLVSDPLPDGTYTINASFIPSTTSTNASFVGALYLDGIPAPIKEFRWEPSDTDDSPVFSISAPVTITGGLNQPVTLELRFGRERSFSNTRAQLYYTNLRISSEVS